MDIVCVDLKDLKGITPEQMIEGKIKPGFNHVRTHMVFI